MNDPLILVFGGPSGSGKSTITKRLLELPGVRASVSVTTRTPRPGEVEGVDYHFITRSRFEELAGSGELLEWAEVHGRGYGTPRSELQRRNPHERAILVDVDVQGLRSLRRAQVVVTSVFIAPPCMEELERRLKARGADSESSIALRLANARNEMLAMPEYDHVITNRDVAASVATVLKVLEESSGRVA